MDEGKVLRQAVTRWQEEALELFTAMAKAYPAMFRRGITGLLEEPPVARDRQQARRQLAALPTNPDVYNPMIEQEINRTSEQELLDLLGRARHQAT